MPRTAFKAAGGASTASGRFDSFAAPLTLGTAGHVDHGKTSLVAALTGVNTDRLPEEHARGISIALGYAQMTLPAGQCLSLVDVPGHERFVRTMVAGATGIDLYMMVIAADDGVMPQTIEHAAVLAALDVHHGIVAVTKTDLADPASAAAEARALLPGAAAIVPCSSVTDAGMAMIAKALQHVAAEVPSRAIAPGPVVLHVDRVFTIKGIGTVITGTLWSGTLHAGDELVLLPSDQEVRVRSVQIHGKPVAAAAAGQRVAVGLAGVRKRAVQRGDVLATPGARKAAHILDCALDLHQSARHGERVHVHHGTRDAAGRLAALGDGMWQLRLESALLAADGDRIVVRRVSPPDTLGGGIIIDAAACRHGRQADVLARLAARRDGRPKPDDAPNEVTATASLAPPAQGPDPEVVERVAARMRAAGASLLSEAQLGSNIVALATLRSAGRVVRVSGTLYGDAEAVAELRRTIMALLDTRGTATLAEVRDALGTSRKVAQAILEHLDNERTTRRLPDNSRVLRRRATAPAPTP